MANKTEHIDDFLNQKFEDFNALPDTAAWHVIAENLSHLSHPIDQNIHQHLSELSDEPDTHVQAGILALAATRQHPIDLALQEKLSVLESIPDKLVYQEAIASVNAERTKKRRLVLWFLLALILGLSVLFVGLISPENSSSIGQKENKPDKQEQTTKLNSHTAPLSDGFEKTEKRMTVVEDQKQSKQKHNPSGSPFKTRETSEVVETLDFSSGLSDASDVKHMTDYDMEKTGDRSFYDHSVQIKLYKLFKHQYLSYDFSKITHKTAHPLLPKKKLSPFSINIQLGYNNESMSGTQLNTENVHKDALSNFNKANGKSRNGDIVSIHLGYRFGQRFVVKTGFQYSYTVTNSHLNYTYNELPVYNAQGVLKGYFIRPGSQSTHVDENIKNKTTSFSVPVQLYMKVFEHKKLSIWTGLGSDLVLKRTSSGRLFSFDTEEMKDFKSTSKNIISPNVSMLLQYHLSPGIALTANLQGSYLSSRMVFEQITFKKQEIMPSLRLGLLITPIIPAK